MFNSRILLGTSLLAACSISLPAHSDWSAGIEAGAQLGSDDSPAIRTYINKSDVPLSHYLYLDWIYESGSYRLGYNPTYTISQSIFSFGEFSIEQDEPGDIDREINARVGIGNNLFRTKNSRFTLRGGFGGSKIQRTDISEESSDGYMFAGGLLTTRLIGLVKFEAFLESQFADSQTVSTGEAGLSLRTGPNTALKYAYSVKRYDFDGSDDIVNEDTFVTVTYGF